MLEAVLRRDVRQENARFASRLAAPHAWNQSPRAKTRGPGLQSGFQRLSSKALLITLTELSAIAPPAITGLR